MPADLLTTREAAAILGLSREAVQRWCRLGQIGTRVGNQYVISRAELATFRRRPRGRPKAEVR